MAIVPLSKFVAYLFSCIEISLKNILVLIVAFPSLIEKLNPYSPIFDWKSKFLQNWSKLAILWNAKILNWLYSQRKCRLLLDLLPLWILRSLIKKKDPLLCYFWPKVQISTNLDKINHILANISLHLVDMAHWDKWLA